MKKKKLVFRTKKSSKFAAANRALHGLLKRKQLLPALGVQIVTAMQGRNVKVFQRGQADGALVGCFMDGVRDGRGSFVGHAVANGDAVAFVAALFPVLALASLAAVRNDLAAGALLERNPGRPLRDGAVGALGALP